jgi:hypothetical protein
MSSSGQYQTAIYNGGIYYSTTYGVNWSQYSQSSPSINVNWSGVAMSSSGQYQTLVSSDTNGIYTLFIPSGTKSFIIDHPLDSSKYLIHTCLEGPEVGVYYRGKSEIENGKSEQIIVLPDYVSSFATDFTVHVTPIYNGTLRTLNCSEVVNNCFTVYGKGRFHWYVFAKRHDIDTEPYKDSVTVKGDGPYKYIM